MFGYSVSISKLIPGFKGLSCALKHKDKETHQHSSHVVELGQALGKKCDLKNDDLTALRMAACLHDTGKTRIVSIVSMR